jgi:hypothetical protein
MASTSSSPTRALLAPLLHQPLTSTPSTSDDDEASSLDGGSAGDDSLDLPCPQDSRRQRRQRRPPCRCTTSTADPLRAERRRSNQLEKELRKARAQLSRFSEINPDEYARLQDAERKREEFERQVGERERQLNEANLRRVRSVEKERDEARCQVQNLRKERLMERLFSEAEGRVGGDERGTFFDTFVTLCGGHFQLGEVDGRERLLPVDGKGQPLTADGVALSDGDYMEELRRHPVYSFLFQQRSGLYSAAVPESGHEHGGSREPADPEHRRALPGGRQGHHAQGGCSAALITRRESDGLVSGVLAQPLHRHGGAGRQRQPGPLPCPAQAEEGLWGDRGRPPRQCPGQPADSPWRLGAAPPRWLQPPVRQCSLQSQGPAAAECYRHWL